MVMPQRTSSLCVITSSNLVGCSTGTSATLAPRNSFATPCALAKGFVETRTISNEPAASAPSGHCNMPGSTGQA